MTPAYADPLVTLYLGDCLDVMRELPDASVDSVVTDPPYGLSFMGKEWDSFGATANQGGDYEAKATYNHVPRTVPSGYMGKGRRGLSISESAKTNRAQQAWHEQWATEAFRVLKPGGYLLAFGGTRTYHRLASAIEDAGFEIRDTLMWIYASGFPKSLDVSKALDKRRTDDAAVLGVTAYIRAAMDRVGIGKHALDAYMGTAGMAQWWTFDKRHAGPNSHGGAAVPKWDQWVRLKKFLRLDDEMDAEVWRLNGRKGKPGEAWDQREKIGRSDELLGRKSGIGNATAGHYTVGGTKAEAYDITAPATDLARKWEGWGTALKPAHEPIVMARKPLVGTVAANVTRYGTGALNIGATRIPHNGDIANAKGGGQGAGYDAHNYEGRKYGKGLGGIVAEPNPGGRWPSNVLLSDPELFDEPNPGVVGSGATSDRPVGAQPIKRSADAVWVDGRVMGYGTTQTNGRERESLEYGDSGGYSRFFLIPKADRAERERGLESLALMLHRERGECDKLGAWERRDQSPSEQTATSSPARDTSGEPSLEPEGSSSATSPLGKTPTAPSPRATRSTTSTGTSRTTTSETSSSLTPPPTSESTPGASLSMGFGGSPAESADSSDPSGTSGGTSPEKAGPSTGGADPATSARWSSRNACADCGKPLPRGSSHPTVKPIDLMRHLVRLVTPPGGVVLDPFLGSGTTALAASEEGFRCIGIEREAEYLEIAKGRLMATPMGLGLDVPASTRPKPKTHPDLSKHQPKRRAPSENYTGGWAGTESEDAA